MEAIQLTDMTYAFRTGLPRADEDAVCTTCGSTAGRLYDGAAFCEPCVVTAVGIWITTCPTCNAGPDHPCAMPDRGYDLSRIHVARERVWDNRRGICPACRAAEGRALCWVPRPHPHPRPCPTLGNNHAEPRGRG